MGADADQRHGEDRAVGGRARLRGGDRSQRDRDQQSQQSSAEDERPGDSSGAHDGGADRIADAVAVRGDRRALVGDPEIAVDEPPEVVAVLLVERIMEMKRLLRLGNLVRRRLLHIHEEARRVGRDRLVEREREEAEYEQQDDRGAEPAEREADGRHRTPRGSKASRSPSPNSVSASTVRKIASAREDRQPGRERRRVVGQRREHRPPRGREHRPPTRGWQLDPDAEERDPRLEHDVRRHRERGPDGERREHVREEVRPHDLGVACPDHLRRLDELARAERHDQRAHDARRVEPGEEADQQDQRQDALVQRPTERDVVELLRERAAEHDREQEDRKRHHEIREA